MLGPYALAILLIATSWLILGASCVGIGLLLRRLFSPAPPSVTDLFVAFWAGWAAMIGLLQLWHLALPVGVGAQLMVMLLGAIGVGLQWRPLLALAAAALRRAPGPLLLLAIALLWMANRATGPAQFYDIGLYYLQAISWNTSYPIVPGLGNLHGRLAFNSSYLLYAALLNVGPLAGKAVYLTNGPLFFALLAQGVLGVAGLAAGWPRRRLAFWSALLLAPTLYFVFGSEASGELAAILHVHGASPDEGVFAIGMALTTLILMLTLDPAERAPGEAAYLRFAIAALASAGVAAKLSFVAFGIAAVVVAYLPVLWSLRREGPRSRASALLPPALCALVIGGVWAARGVILSGYPAYPSTFGAFPVSWRVPTALALSEANWVQSWARQQDIHWSQVLGGHEWLRPWLQTMSPLLSRPIALAALAGGFALASLAGARRPWPAMAPAVGFLLPAAASALFWFVSAPGFRFAGAAFWVLGLGLIMLSVEQLSVPIQATLSRGLVCLAVAGAILLYVAPVRGPLVLAPRPDTPDGLWPLPQAPYQSFATASGLQVLVPAAGNQCWGAPLPCTPYPRGALRLRVPGELGAGFVLDKPREYVDIGGSELPAGVRAPDDLGVALPAGWTAYEASPGQRWMADVGVVLLYTERRRSVELNIEPASILGAAGFATQGQIHVSRNRQPEQQLTLRVGETLSIPLELEPGFSVIRLRTAEGAFVPAEVLPDNPDTRRLSVAFSAFELLDQ